MPKPKSPTLSAIECARRTGLTVRALRVYERHGLIEPARSGKGWRLYGAKELQRLNVIVTWACMTWAAARPPDEIKSMQEYGSAVRPLFRSLQSLREK